MKNGIQQTIGVIKSLYRTTKQRLLFSVSGQFRKTDVVLKKNWIKIIYKTIINMYLNTSESTHKDSNQNIIYLAIALMGVTLADVTLNPNVDKLLMFVSLLILIVISILCIWFINRQAARHEEYHHRKNNFLLKKMSQDNYENSVIRPDVRKILSDEYILKNGMDEYDIDELSQEICRKHGRKILKTMNQYQNRFQRELIKLKFKTLIEPFDWEFIGRIRGIFDYIIVDLGRVILIIVWLFIFITANWNLF